MSKYTSPIGEVCVLLLEGMNKRCSHLFAFRTHGSLIFLPGFIPQLQNLAPQRINYGGFGRKLWHLMSVAVNLLCVPQSGTWQGSIDPDRNRHSAAVSSATAVTVAAELANQSDVLIQRRQRAPQSPTHHNAHPSEVVARLAARSPR